MSEMDGCTSSELRALPSEWGDQRLGDICNIRTGKKDVNEGSSSGKYPFFTCSKDIHYSDSFSFDTEAILVAGNGVVGETKYFRGKFEAYQRTYVLDQFTVFAPYLFLFLKGTLVAELRKHVTGSTMPYIRRGDLENIKIPVPPLPEQRKIAAVLGVVQRAIEQQEQLLRLTAELKKTLLHQLFSQGLRGEPQKQTEVGPVPESWEVVPLGDYLTEAQYGLSAKGAESGQYALLRMTNQQQGHISGANLQYVDLTKAQLEKFRVERQDILFNRTNSHELVGRTAIFDIEGDFVFASYLIRLRTNVTRLRPYFLNHYLNWDQTQVRLKSIATRAVSQSNISATRLRGFSVPVPKPEEQDEIIAKVDCLDRKIAFHAQKKRLLDDLFRTMLHQLMTAQIRVHNLDLPELETVNE